MAFASEGGHWYRQDGSPYYTYQNKDGEWKGTTLREARKEKAGPSVSGIMGVMSAPQLTRWMIEKAIEMADKTPREREEEVEDWIKRVHQASRDENAKAPDLGTAIHGCIEKHLTGETYDETFTNHVTGALDCLGEWCGLDGLHPEKSFFHPLGYGGKCDIHKAGFVCDFKSKGFDEAWPPATYDNHAMQLAAYREGFGLHTARCAIIFVSTEVPGLARLVEIPQKDLTHGWELFKACLYLWKVKNKYDPATDGA